MRKSSAKTALVFILIFSIIFPRTLPGLTIPKKRNLRVAFVGIRFENLPKDIQNIILWRTSAIFEVHDFFTFIGPKKIIEEYGSENLAKLVENQDKAFLEVFAKQFKFDYVFFGTMDNQSPDKNQILLVGELNRYNFNAGHINTYKINVDYDELGDKLLKFNELYVNNLYISDKDSRVNPWSILIALGVVALIMLASNYVVGSGGGEGEPKEPEPTDE